MKWSFGKSKNADISNSGDLVDAGSEVRISESQRLADLFDIPATAGRIEGLSAAYACVSIISSSIACLPLGLYRTDGKKRKRERDHPTAKFLSEAPNELSTWQELREATLWRLLFQGNAYWSVDWGTAGSDAGQIKEILLPGESTVDVELTTNRRIQYRIDDTSLNLNREKVFRPDVAHFKSITSDGIKGITPVEHCRVSLGAAVAVNDMGRRTASAGGALRGIIRVMSLGKDKETKAERRKALEAAVANAQSNNGLLVLEGESTDFHTTSMTLQDAQFIELMKFSVEEIARIFGVPLHKLQSIDRATFNNIEVLNQEFYRATLLPWICRIESVMNRVLLTSSERREGLFFKHNVEGLLRADLKARKDYYQMAVTHGLKSINEIRALEDDSPIEGEGGDDHYFPVNHTTLEKVGEETEPVQPANNTNEDTTDES